MSPTFTRAEVEGAKARKGRAALQPVKAAGELLAVFVPGRLVNTKNARLHYMAESRYKARWREAVALALFEAGWRKYSLMRPGYVEREEAKRPKRIAFLANTARTMDTDGLAVSLAPARDALIECGVILDDAPGTGHEFTYAQQIDRKNRGVTIRVSLLPPPPEEAR